MSNSNSKSKSSIRPLKIAVEGCGHGELDLIYDELSKSCASRSWTLADLDFLIICGDFQALRNTPDLSCLSTPPRYRTLGTFHTYYSGLTTAPLLTLLIGGNHEASNYLSELPHGGWLAPNIYYLGNASVIRYGPYRIAGLSGIFKQGDYGKLRTERLPYSKSEMHSVYHVREGDVGRLMQVERPLDVCLSHDWPRRVEWHGDWKELFKARPTFWESAKIDNLGSPAGEQVLRYLRPRYWFAGHMHVRFEAEVKHTNSTDGDVLEQEGVEESVRKQLVPSMARAPFVLKGRRASLPPKSIGNTVTKFLALDKPGSGRQFLELVEIESSFEGDEEEHLQPYMQRTSEGKFSLQYDEEWLAIERAAHYKAKSKEEHQQWVRDNVTAKNKLRIPENFERHAPVYDPEQVVGPKEQPPEYPNSQTQTFRELLRLDDDVKDGDGAATFDDNIVFG